MVAPPFGRQGGWWGRMPRGRMPARRWRYANLWMPARRWRYAYLCVVPDSWWNPWYLVVKIRRLLVRAWWLVRVRVRVSVVLVLVVLILLS